jgi:hypothetical protein
MADIDVREADGPETFDVSVTDGPVRTRHRVTVPKAQYERFSGGAAPPEELVRRSFEFMLEREPAGSILREFEIGVIARYFPEYEREIRRRLGA